MVFDCASDKADIYANERTCKQNIELNLSELEALYSVY